MPHTGLGWPKWRLIKVELAGDARAVKNQHSPKLLHCLSLLVVFTLSPRRSLPSSHQSQAHLQHAALLLG